MTDLLCACCLQEAETAKIADTIAQGSAMCAEHFLAFGLTYEVAEQTRRLAQRNERVDAGKAAWHAQHPRPTVQT